ncbi:AAA family ATPase [Polyangium sorediatum]|uniref:AAA family ATPase n=1 Tax=Polyangium sorediatum TaxID=889274 RepID=A0ABT6P8F1_9BACT|nr:AAA family ATPase [Polyangium sorediatum]MDI1436904.1 AAA family ATPase [Polyangium sorediatum]
MMHSKAFEDAFDVMGAPSPPEMWRKLSSAVAPSWRVERSSFVGRADSIRQLKAYLDDGARLVTILGAPGLGKTRLLRRLGGMLADEGARVHFFDLTTATTRGSVIAIVSRQLGLSLVRDGDVDETVAQIGHALAARGPMVLLLDNFEQVVEHAETTIGRWLVMAPLATLIVTSREALRLEEEVSFEIQPLTLEEGVRLFEDRARLVRPDLAITGEERDAVLRIVEHLEGIPLAIELAAARTAILLPSEIDTRLGSPFGLLRTARRGAPERHQTLERAIDGSFDLLMPWEKAAFAQCSVFRGGFSLQAAEAVLDLTPHPEAPPVLDVLAALCHKSLLRRYVLPGPSNRTRFGMFESLRVYAAGKLDEASSARAERRHSRHFVEAAEAWALTSGAGFALGLEQLALESSNILQVARRRVKEHALALRAALALDALFARVGPLQARVDLLEDVSMCEQAATPELRIRYLRMRAEAHWMSYPWTDTRPDLKCALSLARQEGDRRAEVAILVALAAASIYQTEPQAGGHYYRQAVAAARLHGDRAALAMVLCGPDDEVLDPAEILALVEELEDLRERTVALGNLIIRRMVSGELERALEAAELTRAAAKKAGAPMLEAVANLHARALELFLGRAEDASRLEQVSEQLRAQGGGFPYQVSLLHLMDSFHCQGRFADLRAIVDRMIRERASSRYPSTTQVIAAYLGVLEAEDGRIERAEAHFAEARANSALPVVAVKVHLLEGCLDVARARRAAMEGRWEEMRARLDDARRRLTSFGDLSTGPIRLTALGIAPALERALAACEAGVFPPCLPAPDEGSISAPPPEPALELDSNGRWFRLGKGEKVSLHRRHVLAAILARLSERHAAVPGDPLPVAELVEAGWPGERILPGAAANRLHNAVAVLRGLGLRGALITRDGGYLLDPALVVRKHRDLSSDEA